MNQQKSTAEYFCTRPRLAAYLIAKGHEAKRTVNPFAPSRTAWTFPKSDNLEADVNAYYVGLAEEVARGESV